MWLIGQMLCHVMTKTPVRVNSIVLFHRLNSIESFPLGDHRQLFRNFGSN